MKKLPVKLGFTYDLRQDYLNAGYSEEETAEFDSEDTIEGIAGALERLGYEVDRIGGVNSLIKRLEAGARWDLVFNICEGLYGPCREAQVPVLLDIYRIPHVFSGGLELAVTLDKGITKHIIRDHGLATAAFKVIRSLDDLHEISLTYPLFVKPIGEGTGKGIGPDSKVNDYEMLRRVCQHQLTLYRQPVLIEEFLPGREITVGILGSGTEARVPGMMEVQFMPHESSSIYSYENKANYTQFVHYSLVEEPLYKECEDLALKAWMALGCKDAGRVDLRCDKNGVPCFMEVNPLAGLNPEHSDLPILARMHGIDFGQLIALIMDCASQRLEIPKPAKLP